MDKNRNTKKAKERLYLISAAVIVVLSITLSIISKLVRVALGVE